MLALKLKPFLLCSWCWDPAACCRASGLANATWRCRPSTLKPSQSSHRCGSDSTLTTFRTLPSHYVPFAKKKKKPEKLIRSFIVRKSDPAAAASWKLRWQEASRSPTTGCWSSWQPATEQCTRTAAAVSRPWARPPSSWVRSSNPSLALAGHPEAIEQSQRFLFFC